MDLACSSCIACLALTYDELGHVALAAASYYLALYSTKLNLKISNNSTYMLKLNTQA